MVDLIPTFTDGHSLKVGCRSVPCSKYTSPFKIVLKVNNCGILKILKPEYWI